LLIIACRSLLFQNHIAGPLMDHTFSPARKYAKSRWEPPVWFPDPPDGLRGVPLKNPRCGFFGIPAVVGTSVLDVPCTNTGDCTGRLPWTQVSSQAQCRVFDGSYFLSGEKVCKEPLGTSRMVPRPSRRPKGGSFGNPSAIGEDGVFSCGCICASGVI